MENILIGVLTKTLNKSEQELSELLYQTDGDEKVLKESAVDDILALDAKRVENIKKNAPADPERLQNEYKRGQKESMEKIEKTLKETYSFDSEKQGIELIDALLSSQRKQTKMSDDDVKKHPLYMALEKERIPKEKHEAVVKEYNDYKANQERREKFSVIKDRARSLLTDMKPIVSENPTVARTREEDFLRKFEGYDYQVDGDSIVILKPDGSRMEDGHGNPLPFTDMVKNVAQANYDFPKQDPKGGTGGGDNNNPPKNITVPKTADEYMQAVAAAKTVEEKVAIKEAYHAQQGK